MKIITTNIGDRKEVSWNGKTVVTGIFKSAVHRPIFLGETDVTGDNVVDRKHHGGIDKACYSYSADHYDYWKTQFPDTDLSFGAFGENLTVQGMDERHIRIGNQYRIGEDVIVEVAQPRQPCMKLGIRFGTQRIVKAFIQAPYSGVYFRVLKAGFVSSGDEFVLTKEMTENPTICDVHGLLGKNKNLELAKKTIQTQELAIAYLEDVKRIYKL